MNSNLKESIKVALWDSMIIWITEPPVISMGAVHPDAGELFLCSSQSSTSVSCHSLPTSAFVFSFRFSEFPLSFSV